MGSTARRPPPATGSLHLRNSETVKVVFVDTAYWIAVFSTRDPWRDSARQARRRMCSARQITTDDVLVEFLAACAAAAPLYPNRSCRIRSRCPHASQHRSDPTVAGNFPQGSDAL